MTETLTTLTDSLGIDFVLEGQRPMLGEELHNEKGVFLFQDVDSIHRSQIFLTDDQLKAMQEADAVTVDRKDGLKFVIQGAEPQAIQEIKPIVDADLQSDTFIAKLTAGDYQFKTDVPLSDSAMSVLYDRLSDPFDEASKPIDLSGEALEAYNEYIHENARNDLVYDEMLSCLVRRESAAMHTVEWDSTDGLEISEHYINGHAPDASETLATLNDGQRLQLHGPNGVSYYGKDEVVQYAKDFILTEAQKAFNTNANAIRTLDDSDALMGHFAFLNPELPNKNAFGQLSAALAETLGRDEISITDVYPVEEFKSDFLAQYRGTELQDRAEDLMDRFIRERTQGNNILPSYDEDDRFKPMPVNPNPQREDLSAAKPKVISQAVTTDGKITTV